jgi:hypothetical protein
MDAGEHCQTCGTCASFGAGIGIGINFPTRADSIGINFPTRADSITDCGCCIDCTIIDGTSSIIYATCATTVITTATSCACAPAAAQTGAPAFLAHCARVVVGDLDHPETVDQKD